MQPSIRSLLTIALTLTLGAPALAGPASKPSPASKAAPSGVDPQARPQDDLFRHVNGGWLDATEIPGDQRSYGTFMILRERADEDVRALLEEAAKKPVDANAKRIGDYYAALADLKTIEQKGLAALKPQLAAIDAMRSLDDVAAMLGALPYVGTTGPVVAYVSPDQKAPGMNAVYWTQTGLGLPDRDYYLKDGADAEAMRQAYQAYLDRLLKLAKLPGDGRDVLAFERAIAQIHWGRVERRDAVKTYNPVPRAKWTAELGAFPWERYAAAAGMPKDMGAIVREPSFMHAFSALAAETPISTWKAYLSARLLDAYAEYMGAAYRGAYHGFKGKRLQGLASAPPAWKVAVTATNDALGEAVGARYVAKRFPPAAKVRMRALVDNLLAVYRTRLERLAWMAPATRAQALDKLSKFSVKIGYPDRWRGYDALVVKRDDAVGNVLRACRFDYARDMAEAGKAVDRSRWHMTPQTVNAYYSPVANEIVFPAAILQPPFFDMKGDDAYNYGAIGAVIGHEISHGFDDQGRRYDGTGQLRDWWTPEDEKAFMARAERLVAQYAAYEPLPGLHVDGKLTLGENIADLAGVDVALEAYRRSLGQGVAPVRDGLSGTQRFFTGYARVWRSKSRPEYLRMRLVSDPHSPEAYRTNGVVTNLDAFYEAFDLKPGDKLYKHPEERVRVW